ncbi:alpha/beta hydrolase [Pediococcus cellicola]|uniref:Family S9 peptidase n=1 Tax=Pediococcus cellicola TaxID=319652 RepID=A0A0R2IWQ2_9LACO|nr:alpha/beta fold hydrolase [Pediococcus cellicola]KRN66186.1 family S9 peptidase [Pediococcus cellicola]GEL15250.1 alpha/beta hydrolase [Pediococcus cellicola]
MRAQKILKVAGISLIGVAASLGISSLVSYQMGIRSSKSQKRRAIRNARVKDNTPDSYNWYKQLIKQTWFIRAEDGIHLAATYLNNNSRKTVILAHGYHHAHEQMIPYAKLFMDLGYNVLMPDARGHGISDGNIIGFGWLDRRDYIKWIKEVNARSKTPQKIVLFGISMGAATVLATAGEADLPDNVVAVVEDSGFSSAQKEFSYRLGHHYYLPPFLSTFVSLMTSVTGGYSLKEADIAHQAANIKIPVLMIHGDADRYVPIEMMAEIKASLAKQLPKESHRVSGVDHVASRKHDPKKYHQTIETFLNHWVDQK